MTINGKLWTKDFIFLSISNLLMSTGFYFLLPVIPIFVVSQLNGNKSQVGYVLAAYTITALLIRPIIGYAVDRWGRKGIYIFSFLLFALLMAVYPTVESVLALLVLRLFHGLTWGSVTTGGSTIIADLVPSHKRGQGMGIYGISMTLAMAIGPWLALYLLDDNSFERVFFSAAIVAFAGFLLLLAVKYPIFIKPKKKPRFSLVEILEPRTLHIGFVQMLFGFVYSGIIAYITLYASEMQFGGTGIFFLLLATGVFVTRLFAGKIFDNKGPVWLMIVGFTVKIAGLLLLSFFKTQNGFYLSAVFFGLGAGTIWPVIQAMANNMVEPWKRGAANASVITSFDLGIGLGSLLIGAVSDKIGLDTSYALSAIIALGALLYFLFKAVPHYAEQMKKQAHLPE